MQDQRLCVQIINIGTELTEGNTLNKNGFWIAQQFKNLHLNTLKISTIPDGYEELKNEFIQLNPNTKVVICTGGLGPTPDDTTRFDFAKIMQINCEFSPFAQEHIVKILGKRGLEFSQENQSQCYIPTGAVVLENQMGTACGIYFKQDSRHYFLLPGVPFEMKHLFETQVIPRLPVSQSYEVTREILTEGIGESLQNRLLNHISFEAPFSFASLPSAKGLLIRIKLRGQNLKALEENIEIKKNEVLKALNDHRDKIISSDKTPLLQWVIQNLKNYKLTLCAAESCTGGLFSQMLTDLPGASEFFYGSIVAYDNSIKNRILGVSAQTLEKFGAVSEECAHEMAQGALELYQTNLSIAVTGIAGPSGGSDLKPVGTICFSLCSKEYNQSNTFYFRGSREEIRERAANKCLQLIREFILKNYTHSNN